MPFRGAFLGFHAVPEPRLPCQSGIKLEAAVSPAKRTRELGSQGAEGTRYFIRYFVSQNTAIHAVDGAPLTRNAVHVGC